MSKQVLMAVGILVTLIAGSILIYLVAMDGSPIVDQDGDKIGERYVKPGPMALVTLFTFIGVGMIIAGAMMEKKPKTQPYQYRPPPPQYAYVPPPQPAPQYYPQYTYPAPPQPAQQPPAAPLQASDGKSYCPGCGYDLKPFQQFCPQCGQRAE